MNHSTYPESVSKDRCSPVWREGRSSHLWEGHSAMSCLLVTGQDLAVSVSMRSRDPVRLSFIRLSPERDSRRPRDAQGDPRRRREVQRDLGRLRETQESPRRPREVRKGSGRLSQTQGDLERSNQAQGIPGRLRGTQGGSGRPREALRVQGRPRF